MTNQHILKVAQSTIQIVCGLTVGSGLLLTTLTPAHGQVGRPTPLEDLQTKDGSDFFNGRGNSQTGSVMNFIQNAIIGTPRSAEEFSSEQQENFNEATSQFLKQQAEALRKRQAQPATGAPLTPSPATPVTPSSSN